MALLEVNDLHTSFETEDGIVSAVNGVSFSIERGKVLGIVGESGSGKSVMCLTMVGLVPKKGSLVSGHALFKGEDLLQMTPRHLREIRGQDISMIFQDPMTSLHPVMNVGAQLMEAIRLHDSVSRRVARDRSRDMLAEVGIPDPDKQLRSYPHELSGGMRQRVMIAMSLLNNPDLLIADEPTTALDVTTQAQILNLVGQLRSEFDSAIILITHDLGVVAETCDDVLVMYAGQVSEQGTVDGIFEHPSHPYTWGLLGCLPRLNFGAARLQNIAGTPPSLLQPPTGCVFHPRCPYAMATCREIRPTLEQVPAHGSVHFTACHLDPTFRDQESRRLFSELGLEVVV